MNPSLNASFTSQLKPAVAALAALTVITGVIYPVLVTVAAQAVFPWQANGSFVETDGTHAGDSRTAGSALIGQGFASPRYFWSRVSSTSPAPYNAASSSGSNLGPTNPALIDAAKGRVAALRSSDGADARLIPVDLVTSSGSGLDPHISPAAAEWQIPRVAAARGIDAAQLKDLVARHTERRQLGILGEPRVNVLLLNLALDRLQAR
jgi:K+-transporting ATPase ATPase C chain